MARWLTKASGALRGEAAREPVPFEVLCECGTRHSGLRRLRHQQIICRSCGSSLFILPRDPYPPPLPRRQKSRSRRQGDANGDDPTAAATAAAEAVIRRTGERTVQATKRLGHSAAHAARRGRSTLSGWGAAFRSLWTPFRIVVLAIVVAIAMTVGLTVRQSRLEQAAETLKSAPALARQALEDGNTFAAQRHLAAAAAAADHLGRDDLLARQVRQSHREVSALVGLAPADLFSLLEEADAAVIAGTFEQWRADFQNRFGEDWLLLDVPVTPGQRTDAGMLYVARVPLPVAPGGRALEIHMRLRELDRVPFSGDTHQVIAAVQLADCRLREREMLWILETRQDSAFLWVSADNYRSARVSFGERELSTATQDVLANQARLLGLPAGSDESDGNQ